MGERKSLPRLNPDAIKVKSLLSDVAPAMGVELRKKGRDWWGCCPFHAEKSPSFSIFEKAGFQHFYCHGCGEKGDVIAFVMKMRATDFIGACRLLDSSLSIAAPRGVDGSTRAQGGVILSDKAKRALAEKEASRALKNRQDARIQYHQAQRLGDGAQAPLEIYLRARGIDPARIGGVPASLRFSPASVYTWEDKFTPVYKPAMLAPVQGKDGKMIALHRTFLRDDYAGKTDAKPAKKILGGYKGGCIRLSPLADHLLIAEGIETALSVRQAFPHQSVWAACALNNFAALDLPDCVTQITILGDNDMKEPREGQKHPLDTLKDAAASLKRAVPGRKVLLALPDKGCDFNDMLQAIGGQA